MIAIIEEEWPSEKPEVTPRSLSRSETWVPRCPHLLFDDKRMQLLADLMYLHTAGSKNRYTSN